MGNEHSSGASAAESRGAEVVSLGERRYLRAVRVAAPTAMILCLHGHGGWGAQLRRSIGHQLEHVDGLLVVYPDGVGRAWNDGRSGDDEPNDVAFLTELIRAERARYPSITRVCCTGMSNGAMMTFRMLRDCPGLIQCFAPVCGLLPRWPSDDGATALTLPSTCEHSALGIKVVLIVGMLDKLVPVCGGAVGRIMRSEKSLRGDGLEGWEARHEAKMSGKRGEVHSLSETCEALERLLGTRLGVPHRLESETTYTGEERRSEDGRLRVLTVREGGHQWPGSMGAGTWLPFTGKVPTFSAGAEILKSFLDEA